MESKISLIRLYSFSAEAVYKLVDHSRDQLTNLKWAKNATLASTHDYLLSKETPYLGSRSPDRIFGIYLASTLIGVIELRDKHFYEEVGYWLDIDYRGNNYMVQAVKLLNEYTTKPLTAKILRSNKASAKVLFRSDFRMVDIDDDWIYFVSLTPCPERR